MKRSKPPVSVMVIAVVYLAVGTIGFAYHLTEVQANDAWDAVWIELTEALAIVAGVFLWRGRDWARWLAIAWMAFHVVLSAFHNVREFGMHFALCGLIAWLLFRDAAGRYFRGEGGAP